MKKDNKDVKNDKNNKHDKDDKAIEDNINKISLLVTCVGHVIVDQSQVLKPPYYSYFTLGA